MYWNPGDPFKPKEPLTIILRNARITNSARGWVTFNDGLKVSFYLERGIPGSDWIEAQTDLATFGANFVRYPIDRWPTYPVAHICLLLANVRTGGPGNR
jgi:hypothetical protein